MICKKCGHDVTKHDVIMIKNSLYDVSKPFCPCGAKL